MNIQYSTTTAKVDEETNVVYQGLRAFNQNYLGDKAEFLGFYAKDEDKNIIGGALTFYLNNEMLLDTIWIDKHHRGQGIGRMLLQNIEKAANEHNIETITVDTYDFQAEDFYKKSGFELQGRFPKYMNGHDRLFLRKKLK